MLAWLQPQGTATTAAKGLADAAVLNTPLLFQEGPGGNVGVGGLFEGS